MVVDPDCSRRAFLKRLPVWSAFGFGAAPLSVELHAAAVNQATGVEPPIPIVDTHVHLWDLAAVNVPWVKAPGWEILNRNYLTDDFKEATRGLHVVLGVYMEVYVDPADLDKEAEYVINLCKRGDTPIKAAVIGGRPESPRFRDYIAKVRRLPIRQRGASCVAQRRHAARGLSRAAIRRKHQDPRGVESLFRSLHATR